MDYLGQSVYSGGNTSFVPAVHVMPLTATFLYACLILWSNFIQWTSSVQIRGADNCSGYKASNVQRSHSSLTADLTLMGTPCNVYGEDLGVLKFLAEWQTGMFEIS
jgi:alpha-glucosidase